jgi:hypothetical protein
MSTEKQTEANRLNAQKSTGPKTPEGKAKVSQNAVTHGLTAFRPVLANENPEEYTLFRDDFFRHHAPAGILEQSLAQRAADTLWRLQRAQDYETAVLNNLITEARSASDGISSDDPNSLLGQVLLDDFRQNHCLEKIQKYEMAIERSYFRTVKELRHLQSQRLQQAASSNAPSVRQIADSNMSQIENRQSKIENEENKPKIPPFDPMKLLENMKTNPFELDPLTKIMMKKDNFRPLTKKAM